MKRMRASPRVLLVNSIRTGGGITEASFTALDMLKRGGATPMLAIPADFHDQARLDALTCPVHRVDGLGASGALAFPGQCIRLARLCAQVQPDILLLNNGRFVRFMAWMQKADVVAVYHGGKPKRFLPAKRIVTINDPQREAMIALGYPAEAITVVDNALPVETLPAFAPRPLPSVPTIGTLRLLEHAKGVDILIEALALLAGRGLRLPLRIGSDGTQACKLKALARERGIADLVTFTGYVEDREVFYRSLDLYVLPSRHEEWGIGLVEAQAASLPIIATDCLGPLRLVEDGKTGLIVPRENPQAMADAIAKLVASPDLCARLAHDGYHLCAARYTMPIVAERYAKAVLGA
jgi:glycosyltransferase involved in cell wall biosynthesis